MDEHPFSLAGQTVLVVGASSGIGAATAALANQLGANVVLASRSAGPLEKVREGLAHPKAARVATFDYLDAKATRAALVPIERIDHVVIPAVADENKKRGAFLELDEATMHASFDKFWGQVNVLRASAPKMPPGGSATLFSSIAGMKPPGKDAGLSVMNAVQAAVMQLGRSLAIELAPVRVNVIAPGVVLTNVWSDAQRTDLERWMKTSLPAQHAGRPEDLAQAVVSLMANRYVTGTVLTVDGGLHLV
jgi:NAD(P)-dependent dehydrogenase (short-subunit alcohol dehydrogenase family)